MGSHSGVRHHHLLDVRACPCLCPLGDARLTPLAFLRMHASGEISVKAWPFLLFLVLAQGVELLFCVVFLLGAVEYGNESPLGR